MTSELPRDLDPIADNPVVTHRPLNSDTVELDQLSPRERARVEKVMEQIQADIEKVMDEQFIGTQTAETIQKNAEQIVAGWNNNPEWLREFAQAMTGNPVESCRVVLDGFEGSNMLISYQIDFARRGPHFEAWKAEQEGTFADARDVAKRILHEELPEDGLEPRTMDDLLAGDVKAGDVIPFADGSSIEVVVGAGDPGWGKKSEDEEPNAE